MTVLKFNPTGSLLVTGSPDNSIRVVSIPNAIGGSCKFSETHFALYSLPTTFLASAFLTFILLAILVLLLALVARQYPGVLPW